jgi:hypothetical protein
MKQAIGYEGTITLVQSSLVFITHGQVSNLNRSPDFTPNRAQFIALSCH